MNTNTTRSKLFKTLSAAALAIALGAPAAIAQVQVNSSWSITRNEGGKQVTVSSANGEVTAKVDGQDVPADRIVHGNGMVSILDDKGNTIFEQQTPDAGMNINAGPRVRMFRDGAGVAGGRRPSVNLNGDRITINRDAAEPPKVMVGVQLVEPDSSVRGHFGLKEGDATMVAAIYDGLPAAAAGLKPYDVILSVDGKSPASSTTVREALRSQDEGKPITLEVLQKGEKKTITVTPIKFDAQKFESAKVDAIASSDQNPPLDRNNVWNLTGPNGQPFIMTLPGPNADQLIDNGDMPEPINLNRRFYEQFTSPRKPGGADARNLDKLMEERMKRMEEMMQKMMERQNAAPEAGKSNDKTSMLPVNTLRPGLLNKARLRARALS